MSDLTDALRHMADEAARQARPLSATDVIRRGNRRRHRTIAQRSLGGGLSALGISAAVLLTGSTSGPQAPSAATAPRGHGVISVTETTTSANGRLTLRIRYRDDSNGKLQLLDVRYAGTLRPAERSPLISFQFIPPHSGQASLATLIFGKPGTHHLMGRLHLTAKEAATLAPALRSGMTLIIKITGNSRNPTPPLLFDSAILY